PIAATPAKRDQIVRDFKKALNETGLLVPMATTNLFTDPAFKDGAFTSNDAKVRAYALQKTMRSMDLGYELGARVYVMWGGREGTESDATKNPLDAMKRMRDAVDFLCEYARDQKYDYRFALEAKPNEPRGDIYLPTTGAMLGFIATLAHPGMVGVNPEVAHEHMAGLNFLHAIAQAWDAGKLFHIDLNDQAFGRYDQDFRFGANSWRRCFLAVRSREAVGYRGSRHFDAHAYRTEDVEGVKAFARGCMRTYELLAERAKKWNADPEIKGILAELAKSDEPDWGGQKYSAEKGKALKAKTFDRVALGARGRACARLDQLTIDVLRGAG